MPLDIDSELKEIEELLVDIHEVASKGNNKSLGIFFRHGIAEGRRISFDRQINTAFGYYARRGNNREIFLDCLLDAYIPLLESLSPIAERTFSSTLPKKIVRNVVIESHSITDGVTEGLDYPKQIRELSARIFSDDAKAESLFKRIKRILPRKGKSLYKKALRKLRQIKKCAIDLRKLADDLERFKNDLKRHADYLIGINNRRDEIPENEWNGFMEDEKRKAERVSKGLHDFGIKGMMQINRIYSKDEKAETIFSYLKSLVGQN